MFLKWVFRIGGLALVGAIILAVLLGLLTGWNLIQEDSTLVEILGRVADVLLIAGVVGGVSLLPNAIRQVWRKRELRSAVTTAALLALVICFFGFSGYVLYTRTDNGDDQ